MTPGGQRIGVPVAEPEHSLLDRGAQVGRHLAPVALPQSHEVQQVEVARVLERVDLVEGALEVRRSDAPQVEVERAGHGRPGPRTPARWWARCDPATQSRNRDSRPGDAATSAGSRSHSPGRAVRRRWSAPVAPTRPPSPRAGTRPECSPVVAQPSRRRPAPQWPNAVFLAPGHPSRRPARRRGNVCVVTRQSCRTVRSRMPSVAFSADSGMIGQAPRRASTSRRPADQS